jgi:hypothetical protein
MQTYPLCFKCPETKQIRCPVNDYKRSNNRHRSFSVANDLQAVFFDATLLLEEKILWFRDQGDGL